MSAWLYQAICDRGNPHGTGSAQESEDGQSSHSYALPGDHGGSSSWETTTDSS